MEERKIKIKNYNKSYYELNKEKLKQKRKERYYANLDKERESSKERYRKRYIKIERDNIADVKSRSG